MIGRGHVEPPGYYPWQGCYCPGYSDRLAHSVSPFVPPSDLLALTEDRICRFEALVRLINATGLKPVVDKVFSFEETRAAYEYLNSQQHVGKVCVQVAKN